MRTRTLLTVALALGLLAPATLAQRIKVTTQTVPIYTTVVDSQRRLVTDLQQEDFEVYDNGKLQTLTNFIAEITLVTAPLLGSSKEHFSAPDCGNWTSS